MNKVGNAGGISKLTFKGGAAGKPKLQVRPGGGNLQFSILVGTDRFFQQDPAVIIQLHSGNSSRCWSSTFAVDATEKSDGTKFTAVTP